MGRIPKPAPGLAVDEILTTDHSAWLERSRPIGSSREGRPIHGFEAGRGELLITLIGGCHADEPVGPALLGRLAGHLSGLRSDHPLLAGLRWRIVPHVNPDGEAKNDVWARDPQPLRDHRGEPDHGYDLAGYLSSVVRELPGDDIEFGFPSGAQTQGGEEDPIRPENRAVAEFLAPGSASQHLPICLHGSFHGMGLAPGPWFLIERSWIDRTTDLRKSLSGLVEAMGYRLFDAERHGEKGFHRIEPGFATRPDSRAMRYFFEQRGDPDEAAKFRPSSMEFAGANGDDPLTFVTEMPLFLTPSLPPGKVERRDLEAVRKMLLEALARGPAELDRTAAELGVVAMPIRDQMALQLALLREALQAIERPDPGRFAGSDRQA
ncbi:MAG: M14 family zinc carboxypeptidase [Thermoanaerobaculia bacterium]